MTIRLKIRMLSFILVVFFSAFFITLFIFSDLVDREQQRFSVLKEMHSTIDELNLLFGEYVVFKDSDLVQRWDARYALGRVVLERAIIEDSSHQLIEGIGKQYALLPVVFAELTRRSALHTDQQFGEVDFYSTEEKHLSLLLQSILSSSDVLQSNALSRLIDAYRMSESSALLLMTVLLTVLLVTVYKATENILIALRTLQRGAEIIGSGNLEHHIDVVSDDEIGELSGAFNQMTDKLRASYRDIDIANRKLQETNAQLCASEEGLKNKILELEQFNRLTVDRELKMIELKKEIQDLRSGK